MQQRKPIGMYILYKNEDVYRVLNVKAVLNTLKVFIKFLPDNGIDISTGRHCQITDCDENRIEQLQFFMNQIEFPNVYNKLNYKLHKNDGYILNSTLHHYCSIIDKNLLSTDEYRVIDYLQHWALTYELRGYKSIERCYDEGDQNISPVADFVRSILSCHHLVCDSGCPFKFDRSDYCYDFSDYSDCSEADEFPPEKPETFVLHPNQHVADEIREAVRRSPNQLLIEYVHIDAVSDDMLVRQHDYGQYDLFVDQAALEPFASLYELTVSPMRNILGNGSQDRVSIYKKNDHLGIVMGNDSFSRDTAIEHKVIIPDLIYKHLIPNLLCPETIESAM
ncbi:ORF20 [Alphabaculovirus altermyunipunctae]|uniref:ORF20 n=1 Tax=Mythimna unipuncta nucleopolyhedrovirus TaxID=447897 RepID=A0A346TPF7_9ABAC|nr:ORF20 [Mythimna unipuncta nucleopolyhedrovirus]AXU41467.1 ORF20 [Mythimna unipuncta nucleopolyhedrovirus]